MNFRPARCGVTGMGKCVVDVSELDVGLVAASLMVWRRKKERKILRRVDGWMRCACIKPWISPAKAASELLPGSTLGTYIPNALCRTLLCSIIHNPHPLSIPSSSSPHLSPPHLPPPHLPRPHLPPRHLPSSHLPPLIFLFLIFLPLIFLPSSSSHFICLTRPRAYSSSVSFLPSTSRDTENYAAEYRSPQRRRG